MDDQHVPAGLLVLVAYLTPQSRLGGLDLAPHLLLQPRFGRMNLLSHLGPHGAKLRERLGPKLDQPPIDAVYEIRPSRRSVSVSTLSSTTATRSADGGVIDDDATIVRGTIAIDLGDGEC
jgi:hypothetical protein